MGRTIRFSIAGLMGLVVVVAIGLAALRSGSDIWAGVVFLATCGMLALAIVGVFCRREAERAWWLGFALFGWGYMYLAFWTTSDRQFPNLPTITLLDWSARKIGLVPQVVGGSVPVADPAPADGGGMRSVPIAFLPGGFGGGNSPFDVQGPFVQVGHCLWALLFAVAGGILARLLFAIPPRRSEGQQAQTTSTVEKTWEGWLRPVAIGGVALAFLVLIAVIKPNSAPGLAAGAIYLLACSVFGLAILGAALAEGRARQIWLGAAVFGIGYMVLAFGRAPASPPTPILPTDQLLQASREWLPEMAGGFLISTKVEASNARILRALEQSIPMPFPNETPLDDVLRHIKEKTQGRDGNGIPIYVDPIGLQEAERSLNSTVTVDLHDVPLRVALRTCLKQLGLAYGIRDGFLMITSDDSVPPPFEDPFLMGGHCFFALIAAAAGGILAPLVATARMRRLASSG